MAGDGVHLATGVLILLAGCGAGQQGHTDTVDSDQAAASVQSRFPLARCGDVRPETIGVWQRPDGWAVVYDGCSVRFADNLERDAPVFRGERSVARAFVVDVRDYADPFPYFRTRARWDGDTLQSVSVLGLRHLATWRGGRLYPIGADEPFTRVDSADQLGRNARALLATERFLPTEEELAAERGIAVPPTDDAERDYVQEMMCPGDDCAGEDQGEP